jgi:hypothetical protein
LGWRREMIGKWLFWILPLLAVPANAATWSVEGSLGAAYNFRSPLTIDQTSEERISLTADYETRPFDKPLYYQVRVAHSEGARAWEVSLIHHKLYLRNRPPGVQALSISHGLNLLTLNRAVRGERFTYRWGVGILIAHPEGTIRGISYDGPYDPAGAALLAGVSRRFYFGDRNFVVVDGLATFSAFDTEPGGEPKLRYRGTNAALHLLIGFGHDF